MTRYSPAKSRLSDFDYFEILKILLGNQGYGNIININFIFLNQIQKQVKRTFKNIQFNGIVCCLFDPNIRHISCLLFQILTAARTSSIVWRAIFVAFLLPSAMISLISSMWLNIIIHAFMNRIQCFGNALGQHFFTIRATDSRFSASCIYFFHLLRL